MSDNIRNALNRNAEIYNRFIEYTQTGTFNTNTESGQVNKPTSDVTPAFNFKATGPGKVLSETPAIPEISKSLADYPSWWLADSPGSSLYSSLLNTIKNISNAVKNIYVTGERLLFKPVEIKLGYKDRNPAPAGRISGATDPFAINYNPAANWSDGSELYPFYGDPGPIDSRNIQGNQRRYTGDFTVPNICVGLYPENSLTRDIPYYPFLAKNYYPTFRADNSVYGTNNSYFENADFTADPPLYERKGMVYEFLKAAEYQLPQPPIIYQERQEDLPYGSSQNDSNSFINLKTGDTPRRVFRPPLQALPMTPFGQTVPRRYEIRVNDTLWEYAGDTFYVGNPSNGTFRPGTPPSYYSSLSALVTVLSGSDNTLKIPSPRYPKVVDIFSFSETYPMTGYNVYKNGILLNNNASLSASYDNSGTNKITIFDFTNITPLNPVALRNRIDTLSATPGLPSVNTFIENNNIDQGRFGTFLILEHNGIQSQNIPRPFYFVYCNTLIPSISGIINILN
jgi:hypothetical protein